MLGPRDRRNLAALHPDLARVVVRAAQESPVPFLVGPPASADAVDLYPLLGRPAAALRRAEFAHLVAAIRAAARQEGVALSHGFDRRDGCAARHARVQP
jgi:hypothetical protein